MKREVQFERMELEALEGLKDDQEEWHDAQKAGLMSHGEEHNKVDQKMCLAICQF